MVCHISFDKAVIEVILLDYHNQLLTCCFFSNNTIFRAPVLPFVINLLMKYTTTCTHSYKDIKVHFAYVYKLLVHSNDR